MTKVVGIIHSNHVIGRFSMAMIYSKGTTKVSFRMDRTLCRRSKSFRHNVWDSVLRYRKKFMWFMLTTWKVLQAIEYLKFSTLLISMKLKRLTTSQISALTKISTVMRLHKQLRASSQPLYWNLPYLFNSIGKESLSDLFKDNLNKF